MKNKKINLFFLCLWISILISCNQRDNNMDISTDNTFLNAGVDVGIDYFYMQVDIDNDSEEDDFGGKDETGILYYCEETVMDNTLFVSFLNNERSACDNIYDPSCNIWSICDLDLYGKFEENRFYIKDLYAAYYEKYGDGLIGVQVRSMDMNQDERNELTIIIEYNEYDKENADLHVFHEEEGELYAWESFKNVMVNGASLDIYETGAISTHSGILAKYNDKGNIEIMFLGNWWHEDIEPELVSGHYYERELWHAQNTVYDENRGVIIYSWDEVRYEDERGKPIITPEHQLIKEESKEIIGQLFDEQGKEEYITYTVNMSNHGVVERITLSELME